MSVIETPGRSTESAPLSPDAFREAFRHHAAGVAVVTAGTGDRPVGMTVSSLFSVSAVPPLAVFSASVLSSSTATIISSETVVLHLLTEPDLPLAQLCATSGVDRFNGSVPWDILPTGEPYFTPIARRIRARISTHIDAGASTLIVVEALEATHADQCAPHRPLVYHDRTWHSLGLQSAIQSL